jgi:hypothetical protein
VAEIPDEAPESALPDCNGRPHLYGSYEHGANCPIGVGTCLNCGAIDWADLAEQATRIAEQARREERARIAARIRAIPDDDEEWKTGTRRFIDRHPRLRDGSSMVAVLLAAADEIEETPDV